MTGERRIKTKRGGRKKLFISLGIVVLLCLVPLSTTSPYYLHTLIITFIYVMAAASLRTILLSGQISIAHAAFMGVGAYASAILAKELGWTPWLTMPLGGLFSLVFGAVIGYPLTRVRAIYFSMVSLFVGLAIVALLGVLQGITGGDIGMIDIPPLSAIAVPGLPHIDFDGSKIPYYYFFLILSFLILLVLYRIEHSRIGTSWKAIAQAHMVASAVGINESGMRILAFSVGCFFAGLAGAGYAHYNMVLTRSSFGFLSSINLLIYVLVGGSGSFAGPIIGTAVLVIVPEIVRSLQTFAPFVFGGIMLFVVFFMRQGIAGLFEQLQSKLTRSKKREMPGRAP
jgi:branched-chain amino acid transport system permease protein